MPNIAYFQIPADNVVRAREFYRSLLGWTIEADTTVADPSLEWQNIMTGEPEDGTMNMGGIYRRQGPAPIMNFVKVADVSSVLEKVTGLGGAVLMPRSDIKNVGVVAVIQDTEGNVIGLWTPVSR
jgi:predicted enzyme related to lactoylglutathione lyase